MDLGIAGWKYDKEWVYSVTYDEALSELHRFVIPVHDRLGIPGHLEVVSGHIGKVRNLGASSFNGLNHMTGSELRDMMKRGWGVGCHSYSHIRVMDDPERELKLAKTILEDAIGRAVTIYCSPGDNKNLTGEVIKKCREFGYIAGMSITDDLNYSEADDLFWINRPPLHEKMCQDLYDSYFDEFKRIHQAKKYNGWIVDYLHCPLEKAIHDYKDCSAEHHKMRLEAVYNEGRYDCWFANPDDVVDYRYMKKHTCIIRDDDYFRVKVNNLPEQVINRELTFLIDSPYTPEALDIVVDDIKYAGHPCRSGTICFTVPVKNNSRIEILPKK